MKNVLFIGAHYDDVELGCGGTEFKLSHSGCKVFKLTLTDNVTNFVQKNIMVSYQNSKKASLLASESLGVTEIPENEFLPIPCNSLKYDSKIMQKIEQIIIARNIDTVFMHYPEDMNQDHVEASKLSLTASRHCSNLIYFQSNAYLTLSPFTPTFFIDISQQIEQKEKALAFYGKEHNRFGRLFETNLERNHTYGFLNGTEYCEGFVPVKLVE